MKNSFRRATKKIRLSSNDLSNKERRQILKHLNRIKLLNKNEFTDIVVEGYANEKKRPKKGS